MLVDAAELRRKERLTGRFGSSKLFSRQTA
jgi:hypothetical protein